MLYCYYIIYFMHSAPIEPVTLLVTVCRWIYTFRYYIIIQYIITYKG